MLEFDVRVLTLLTVTMKHNKTKDESMKLGVRNYEVDISDMCLVIAGVIA